MPELRSRARKAAAAEAAPAAKPAPKRKTAKKPPKTQGGSKKTKTADKPMSGDSPIPAVGAAPAAAVPPSPNEKQALEDDPNTVNAEAQAKPPPQPTPPSSDDELPPLVPEHVLNVGGGEEICIRVPLETARWVQGRCSEMIITMVDGHMLIARLATSVAFAASSVPTSVRILTIGVRLPAVIAAIQKIENTAGLKGPVPFQELLVAATQVRADEVINLGPRDLYEYTGDFIEGLDAMPLRDLTSMALGRSALAFLKALLASPTDPVGSAAQAILAEANAANLPPQAAALQANTAARGLRGAGSSRSLNRRAKDQHSSNRDSPGGPTQKPGRCDSRAATRSYLAPSSSHLEVYALPHTCFLGRTVRTNDRCASPERPHQAAQQSRSPRQERRSSPENTVQRDQ